jgi:hypothetical protein
MAQTIGKSAVTSAELLTMFNRQHEQRFDKPAPIVPIADARIATKLLRVYPVDLILHWMRIFFGSDDRLSERSGFTFAAFAACLVKLNPRRDIVLPKLPIDQQYIVKRMLAAMRAAMAG